MSINNMPPVSQSRSTVDKSLVKRIGSTWAGFQAVWKLIEVLEDEDHSIW